jgi:tetratricopeptide (TPR) repeat protein
MFNEAIQDLTTAIDSSSNLVEAYVLRGKCSFINGDINKAYQDFQRVIALRPEDPLMHIHRNILIVNGAYENAIKAYMRAYELGRLTIALFGRAKCNIALCELSEALANLSLAAKADAQRYSNDLNGLTTLNKLCKVLKTRRMERSKDTIRRTYKRIRNKAVLEIILEIMQRVVRDRTIIDGEYRIE